LSSAPIPFTVLSIAGSTCNEDYLAVCGLKVSVHSPFLCLLFGRAAAINDYLID